MKLLNKAETEKAITSIKTRGAKLQSDIHQAACSALDHLNQHGDTSLINRLIVALPASARRNALAKWAMTFGKLALNDDKSTKQDQPLVYLKEKAATPIADAIATPYWALKASETGSRTVSVDDWLGSVLKRALNMLATAKPEERVKIEALITAMGGTVPAPVEAKPVVPAMPAARV